MAGNSGGPWGGGGGGGSGNNGDRGNNGSGGRRPGGSDQQIPEFDEIVRKGQEQLRVLMGGRGGRSGGGGGGGDNPISPRTIWIVGIIAAFGFWAFNSFYTVRPEEQSVELLFGEYYAEGQPGLNFAPWPFITAEVVNVTSERTEAIGTSRQGGSDDGLMLTTDENVVDIDFQVVWNITDPSLFLFNLRDPETTIRAVSEAAMREVIAASQIAPILNRDRGLIADTVQELIQSTLNGYESGVNIVRLNLDRADPPVEVIDAFRDVQAAEQDRDQLERRADAYANQVLADARGQAAQILEQAEGYRAQVVNEAEGEASRFLSVLAEYEQAPDVTRRRLYLETMERVLGTVDLVILDQDSGGSNGVVPYLPLDQLRRNPGESNTTTTTGSSN